MSYGNNSNGVTNGPLSILPLDGNIRCKSYPAIDCSYVSEEQPDTPFPNSTNLFVNLWNEAFIKFPVPYDIDPSLIEKAQIQICGTAVNEDTFVYLMSSNNWNSYTLTYDNSEGILTDDTLLGPVSTSDPNHQCQTATIDITKYLLSAYNNNVNQLSFYFIGNPYDLT